LISQDKRLDGPIRHRRERALILDRRRRRSPRTRCARL